MSRRTAERYYAYASVQKYTDEPFTALTPDTASSPNPNPNPNPKPDPTPDPAPLTLTLTLTQVFNIARYLLAGLLRAEAPFGISKTYCLFALAKQSKALRANKLARFALEKLSQCKVPTSWQAQVDVFALSVRR